MLQPENPAVKAESPPEIPSDTQPDTQPLPTAPTNSAAVMLPGGVKLNNTDLAELKRALVEDELRSPDPGGWVPGEGGALDDIWSHVTLNPGLWAIATDEAKERLARVAWGVYDTCDKQSGRGRFRRLYEGAGPGLGESCITPRYPGGHGESSLGQGPEGGPGGAPGRRGENPLDSGSDTPFQEGVRTGKFPPGLALVSANSKRLGHHANRGSKRRENRPGDLDSGQGDKWRGVSQLLSVSHAGGHKRAWYGCLVRLCENPDGVARRRLEVAGVDLDRVFISDIPRQLKDVDVVRDDLASLETPPRLVIFDNLIGMSGGLKLNGRGGSGAHDDGI